MSNFSHLMIEKAKKDKEELAQEYGIPMSAVVWIGNNRYIVVRDGVEYWI